MCRSKQVSATVATCRSHTTSGISAEKPSQTDPPQVICALARPQLLFVLTSDQVLFWSALPFPSSSEARGFPSATLSSPGLPNLSIQRATQSNERHKVREDPLPHPPQKEMMLQIITPTDVSPEGNDGGYYPHGRISASLPPTHTLGSYFIQLLLGELFTATLTPLRNSLGSPHCILLFFRSTKSV